VEAGIIDVGFVKADLPVIIAMPKVGRDVCDPVLVAESERNAETPTVGREAVEVAAVLPIPT